MHCVTSDHSIDAEKAELRKTALNKIRLFEDKKGSSERIAKRIKEHPLYHLYDTVLAFCPLKSEVDITPLLSDERVLLPYIDGNEMAFSRCRKLIRSSFGFLEPEEKEEYSYERALMIVPLLACDKHNNRLGRGGGFYDRYIEKNRARLYTIGVCYPVSEVEHIPLGPHDQRLDEIIML